MRKAMFMSGHLRSLTTQAVKKLREEFDGDLFVATWDREDCSCDSTWVNAVLAKKEFNAIDLEIENFNSVLESMKLKDAYFSQYCKFDAHCHKGRHGYDSFCMFHIMRKAWYMLKAHEQRMGFQYDMVIRFRPDYAFQGLPATFKPEPNKVYFPQNSVFFNLTDNLFAADRATMEKMMLLPDLLDTYLLKEGATWTHEHLMVHHIKKQGLENVKCPTWLYRCADGTSPGQDQASVTFNREKIIATMLVRNEEDIIGECLQHTLSSGVDEVILMNNNSTDRTREIAASFKNVTIIDEPSNHYQQGKWQTMMAEMARQRGATWVVPIDGDEFWDGIENLRFVPNKFGVALAECLYHHRPTDLIEEPFKRSQMPCYHRLDRKFGVWLSGRFAFRPYRGVQIAMGQDNIIDYKGEIGVLKEMWLHHYPIRSYDRYVNKIKTGVEALNSGGHAAHVGSHWKQAYTHLLNGNLRQVYDTEKILLRKTP